MYHEKIPARQMTAWLMAAMSAPIVTLAGKSGWLETAIVAAVLCLLNWGVLYASSLEEKRKKGYYVLQILWLALITGQLGKWSANAWPGGTDFPVVPVTLLVLGVFATINGVMPACRCNSTLFWLLALVYGLVLLSGIGDIKLERLIPQQAQPSADMMLVFLIPAVVAFVPTQRGKGSGRRYFWAWCSGIVLSLWTLGTLSYTVAQNVQWPFYESCKSLNLFGIAERFEALASAVVTMGYFSLYSLLFGAIWCLGEEFKQQSGKKMVIACGIICGLIVLFMPSVDSIYLIIGSIMLWIIAPLSNAPQKLWKKVKKHEKSA